MVISFFSLCRTIFLHPSLPAMSDPITLNVGGKLYTTSLATLTSFPDSMLGAMFSGKMPTKRDSQGNCFIDRDGKDSILERESSGMHVLNPLTSVYNPGGQKEHFFIKRELQLW